MQPVPSLWAIKADPSPLVQPALSSALRSKIVAQSLALRRGNYWDSSSGEVCEGRGEIRGRKLSPILLNISTSQNFPCFVLSTVSPQTRLVLYLSISLHTNISWLQARNELNVTIYCLRAPLPLPEAEREIHLWKHVVKTAAVIPESNINIHYSYLRTVFTDLTRVLQQNMPHICSRKPSSMYQCTTQLWLGHTILKRNSVLSSRYIQLG